MIDTGNDIEILKTQDYMSAMGRSHVTEHQGKVSDAPVLKWSESAVQVNVRLSRATVCQACPVGCA